MQKFPEIILQTPQAHIDARSYVCSIFLFNGIEFNSKTRLSCYF